MRQARVFMERSYYEGIGGTYASLKPTQDTMHHLMPMHKKLGSLLGAGALLPPLNWHVTVVFDRHHAIDPEYVHEDFPMLGADITFHAQSDGFQWWPGHNNKGYFVLTLFSEGLSDLHELVCRHLELEHSFEEYTPHVTFAEKFLTNGITPEQADEAVKLMNDTPLPVLTFSGLRFEDIRE